ncbi:protein of unknown function [Streptomyces sp. KY75]|nr:protein of unknown function [Streptomyces sp. KY70]CAD5975906.1 protein of unknown function [Streptomyces sp. KY75]
MASIRQCDGCHRKSFQTGVLYACPTTGEFNMCNCTTPTVRPDRSVRGCPTESGTLTHTPAQTRSQTHEGRRDGRRALRSAGRGGPGSRPTTRLSFSRPQAPHRVCEGRTRAREASVVRCRPGGSRA